eukprot:scaffold77213_cov75-Phaeocystis_antarctica.AAC.2
MGGGGTRRGAVAGGRARRLLAQGAGLAAELEVLRTAQLQQVDREEHLALGEPDRQELAAGERVPVAKLLARQLVHRLDEAEVGLPVQIVPVLDQPARHVL